MTLQLILTHAISAICGAAALWALRRRSHGSSAAPSEAREQTLSEQLHLATHSASIGVWQRQIATGQLTTDSMRALLGIDYDPYDLEIRLCTRSL